MLYLALSLFFLFFIRLLLLVKIDLQQTFKLSVSVILDWALVFFSG